jgi:hypothetical protein
MQVCQRCCQWLQHSILVPLLATSTFNKLAGLVCLVSGVWFVVLMLCCSCVIVAFVAGCCPVAKRFSRMHVNPVFMTRKIYLFGPIARTRMPGLFQLWKRSQLLNNREHKLPRLTTHNYDLPDNTRSLPLRYKFSYIFQDPDQSRGTSRHRISSQSN